MQSPYATNICESNEMKLSLMQFLNNHVCVPIIAQVIISPRALGFSPDRLMDLLPEAGSRQLVWLDPARIQIERALPYFQRGRVDGADQQGCPVHFDLFPIFAQ